MCFFVFLQFSFVCLSSGAFTIIIYSTNDASTKNVLLTWLFNFIFTLRRGAFTLVIYSTNAALGQKHFLFVLLSFSSCLLCVFKGDAFTIAIYDTNGALA